jgi:uncharacterized protein (DUF362 family)
MRPTRRHCLKSFASGLAAAPLVAQVSSKADASKLGIPGLYRGRVVAVRNSASIVEGRFQGEPIRQMIRKGMAELTGTDGGADAWRQFVEPGDVVGVKVNPVGKPHVISSPEVVREIIAGLKSAGIKSKDIIVYDRYRKQFFDAGFNEWLPEGVRTAHAAEDYDEIQQSIEGYDPDHYMDMPLTLPGYEATNLTARRSYVARVVTQQINKLVNLPVMKDHQSAGVTLALKNLSHGSVNNVSRSHGTKTANACGAFIPAVVSTPAIRNKVVLNILDGVKALYHGGPGARPQFVWEHKTIYFSTDPVALDRIGWKAIDEKRLSVGMKLIVDDTPDNFSTFLHRQPEHIELAGSLGLGEWDEKKIDLRRIDLG